MTKLQISDYRRIQEGQWYFDQVPGSKNLCDIKIKCAGKDKVVAHLVPAEHARAIAALPVLIEAAQKAMEHLERDAEWFSQENRLVSFEQNMQHVRALRSALSQAIGGQSEEGGE